MTPANTLRLAGLAERAERIGCVLSDPGQIPEVIYKPDGKAVDVCPALPAEIGEFDDEAIDQFIEFALESDNIMLDATEFEIARLERIHAGKVT